MVVEIFISHGDRGDPLRDHGTLIVNDRDGIAWVGDRLIERIKQTDLIGDLAEQNRPRRRY